MTTPLSDRATLRVLHIVAPARVGGLERVVVSLAAAQRERGHDVVVAASVAPHDPAAHPFITDLRSAGIPVEVLAFPGRAYLAERRAVRRLCERLRPAIVHTHGYRPDVLHGSVARRLGIATVSTVHGFTGGDWKNRLFEYLDRRTLRSFDAVVTVSRPQLAQLREIGVSAERLTQIPNAWTRREEPLDRMRARAHLGLPASAFILGFVGRLTSEKGPDVLIEALPKLGTKDWTAVFIGDGPDRPGLVARAAALGLAERIRWAGMVPDAAPLYPALDAFVLSSRTEGIPIVLFEAMHAGTPIVATRVGGVTEVVGEGEALLVPPEDPQALAAGIDAVAAHPDRAAARAQSARVTLTTRFATEPWLDAYDAVYRQAAQRVTAR